MLDFQSNAFTSGEQGQRLTEFAHRDRRETFACFSHEGLDMSTLLIESFESAQFGDLRLSKRLVTIVDRLSSNPNLSIPAAMKSESELEATYRFFNNSRVTPEAILAPHVAATHERIRQTKVALLVQDTTEIDITRPEQQVDGAGPLDGSERRGTFYHPLVAFDDQGLALGTVWNKHWAREKITPKRTKSQKREDLRNTPIEQKESIRWIEGLRASVQAAKACPQTQCICVADSEADIYELFVEPRMVDETRELGLLVRAYHERTVNDCSDHLLAALRALPCLYTSTVDVSRRLPKIKANTAARNQPRDARVAEVEVRAGTFTLDPPERPDRVLPKVTVNVILVEEINTPEGQIPIQWMLHTNLPIDMIEQVKLIIHYYTIRWQIEVYFKTLKSGCRIEERYFEKLDSLENCLAVYTVVAWKVLYLCRLSRECPDLSCEAVFEPCEWKPVYMTVRRTDPPHVPPSINEIVRMIASLGGYVIRKSTNPGTQTLWIGLQRLHDLSTAWKAFGPDTRRR